MALFGLFGKKDKKENSDSQESFYFLDEDSAKTFGNIDYMRTPKAVKKTFPTINGVKGLEVVEIISATLKTEGSEIEATIDNSPNQTFQPLFEPKKLNTSSDSGMDIFLNMAKNINKR